MNAKDRINEVIKSSFITSSNGTESATLDGDFFGKINEVREAIAEENKEELTELDSAIVRVDAELQALRALSDSAIDKVHKRNNKIANLYKVVGKEVGIKMKFLTGSGSLSPAKLRRLDEAEGRAVIELYNESFIPLYTKKMADIEADTALNVTAEETSEINQLNNKITEHNRLLTRKNEILGL